MRLFGLRKMIFFLVFFYCCNLSWGQQRTFSKPVIDSTAIATWPSIGSGDPDISPDGNYVSYWIRNQPVGAKILIVQSTDRSWKKEFINVQNSCFGADNKLFIFQRKDSLYFISLKADKLDYTTGVKNFRHQISGTSDWLIIELNNSTSDLLLQNMTTGEKKVFHNVVQYFNNPGSPDVLIETSQTRQNSFLHQITWYSLSTDKEKSIWSTGDSTVNLYPWVPDKTFSQVVFSFGKNDSISVWYYKMGDSQAAELANNNTKSLQGWSIGGALFGLHDMNLNAHIIFDLYKNLPTRESHGPTVSIDIYSYKDSLLANEQKTDNVIENKMILDLSSGKEIFLNAGERILAGNDSLLIVSNQRNGIRLNWPWWPSLKKDRTWIVSLSGGYRQELPVEGDKNYSYYTTPQARYIIYFDGRSSSYYIYDRKTNISRNVSASLPKKGIDAADPIRLGSVAGFTQDGKNVLIYDQYDIWQISIDGTKDPVNITRGYGRQHHIIFEIIGSGSDKKFEPRSDLLLTAIHSITKWSGFYRINLLHQGDPDSLAMGPYTFFRTRRQKLSQFKYDDGMMPIKADHANAWIVKKQSASSAPDYCITKDFKTFEPFTDVHPEKNYNWLTTELVTYPCTDGRISQGILYKPADFDPQKKYPVIFKYYDQGSHVMYEFPTVKFINDDINIPWFVSRGYLVFVPDITDLYSETGIKSNKTTGDYAASSIVGAAKYLMKRPYIDAKRMGAQGHSFGGGETLDLITHSHLFAAAWAGSPGYSDLITGTFSFNRGNKDHLLGDFFNDGEGGYHHIGATLWQRPDLYIRASPIFKADKVTTPLLIMQNERDNAVDFSQGSMMFIALRRLQKPVWMLQYDNGEHAVFGKDAMDYTIRMTQFFDYYLKGALPPKWMTEGIPRRLKNIDNGFELDNTGKRP